MATPTAVKQSTTELVKLHLEWFNQRRLDEAVEHVASDARLTNVPFGMTASGPEGYREMMQGWIDALPDAKVRITHVVATDEWVAVEGVGEGTHKGTLEWPGGKLAPSNKKLRLEFCELWQFKRGKVANYRLYFDSATMMRQLGAATKAW